MSSRSIASVRQKRAGDPPMPNQKMGATLQRQPQRPPQRNPPQLQHQQQHQQQQQQHQPQEQQRNKISISDAIGLITIRLGRLEQYIQQTQDDSPMSLQKLDPIDKTLMNNITSRLESIEKREPSDKTSKMEQELRDVKDLLMLHIMKFEKFVLETQEKITDLNNFQYEYDYQNEPHESQNDTLYETPESTETIAIIENNEKGLEKKSLNLKDEILVAE